MTSTVIKYSLGDDIRRTTVPAGELTFAGLFGKIAAAFPGAAPGDRKRIIVRYLDDEDEKCTISDDAELAEAVVLVAEEKRKCLRLFLDVAKAAKAAKPTKPAKPAVKPAVKPAAKPAAGAAGASKAKAAGGSGGGKAGTEESEKDSKEEEETGDDITNWTEVAADDDGTTDAENPKRHNKKLNKKETKKKKKEQKKEQRKQAKLDKKAAKLAEKKAAGTYETKKDKERRLAAERRLASLAAQGLVNPTGADGEVDKPKKKIVYDNKKKKQ